MKTLVEKVFNHPWIPEDRVREERAKTTENAAFYQQYGNDEGKKQLETSLESTRRELEEWQQINHLAARFIELQRLAMRAPAVPGDVESSQIAAREIEKIEPELGITTKDYTLTKSHSAYQLQDIAKDEGWPAEKLQKLLRTRFKTT